MVTIFGARFIPELDMKPEYRGKYGGRRLRKALIASYGRGKLADGVFT
jgi:hypothetical protein